MTVDSRAAIDSINSNAHLIPTNMFAVGGYISSESSFRWSTDLWAKFPDSYHIRINTFGEPDRGNCLDVEFEAATPANVEPWIRTRGPVCEDPLLVYCNRSNLNACVSARDAAHKATGHYAFIWCATLDGTLTDRSMTQICQVKTASGAQFGDLSIILDQRLISKMAARIGKQLYWNPEYLENWEPRLPHEYLLHK